MVLDSHVHRCWNNMLCSPTGSVTYYLILVVMCGPNKVDSKLTLVSLSVPKQYIMATEDKRSSENDKGDTLLWSSLSVACRWHEDDSMWFNCQAALLFDVAPDFDSHRFPYYTDNNRRRWITAWCTHSPHTHAHKHSYGAAKLPRAVITSTEEFQYPHGDDRRLFTCFLSICGSSESACDQVLFLSHAGLLKWKWLEMLNVRRTHAQIEVLRGSRDYIAVIKAELCGLWAEDFLFK